MKVKSENQFTRLCSVGFVSVVLGALSACAVAPSQPVGYRMTSSVLPTYVNGQYVGMQPSGVDPANYIAPVQSFPVAPPVSSSVPLYSADPPAAPAPVYVQQAPTVVYVQRSAPIYSYNRYPYPYYAPTYVDPWYGVGVGVGTGIGLGIGINYFRGWGGRGWHRGGWHHGGGRHR